MALDFDAFAIAVWFAPFALALVAPLIAQNTGRVAGWILAIVPAGLFVNLWSLRATVAAGTPIHYALDWAPSLGIRLSLVIDGLSLVFALLITGIGAVILVYSGEYLRRDPRQGRFLATMLAFIGAMLGLVLADSLVALFGFWELTAVTSFLLIGHDHTRPAARRAAFQALTVTGLGGLALLAGGVLLQNFAGTWELSALPPGRAAFSFTAAYPWALGFFAVAAFTKSAQLPFHFWLPNAMEAPTPVSAYLHSAAMVQAGIYLLSRLSPILGGTPLWQALLTSFGAATLLWGALWALARTDLKQILVQTTIASLGLSVLLLGFSGEAAALAVAAYFVAHGLYKASLFLIAGILEHGTGTRDLTALGGLRDHLTISFIAAALAAASMFGLPPFLGWFAKEEMYTLAPASLWPLLALAVLVLGNALLGTAALALLIRPFMGALRSTPETPHEGTFALWIGPVLFGLLSFAVVFTVGAYGDELLAPMASSIAGHPIAAHLGLAIDPKGLPLWLSVSTWALSILFYWQLDRIRLILTAVERRFSWSFDRGFDQFVFGLVRFAGAWTRVIHHGRLELYLVVVFAALALALLVPLTITAGWTVPALRLAALTPWEWGAVAVAAAGAGFVVMARSRLTAIVALGVQGLAMALIFLFFGAPDLGFTQLIIEVLSVVILTLVMTRLHLTTTDPRPWEDWLRDGALALICGAAVTAVLLKVLDGNLPTRLAEFMQRSSVALAHGRNIVNVILVDFRGLDTLGEIAVVMIAGIGVLALLRRQHKREAPAPKPPRGRKAQA